MIVISGYYALKSIKTNKTLILNIDEGHKWSIVMGSKEGIWKKIPYLNGISAGMTSDTLYPSDVSRHRLNTNEYLNNKFVREILP